MKPIPPEAAELSPIKRAFLALEQTQQKLAALELARSEPIAIVGMACRLPGGIEEPEGFWRFLLNAGEGVIEAPAGRYENEDSAETWLQEGLATRRGGFLQSPIDGFDPSLFGISPREAEGMDPQQRLLLELSWEALESAGQMEDRLAGRDTGVFIGITSHDYADLQQRGDQSGANMYSITGTTHNAAAGRISYVFGFHGPCMAIDTACSSSLVALHVACNALHNDECQRALVGGVNLILSPSATFALSQGRVLAEDGVCRAFDAAASGMVRGEGGVVLVLKRLSQAKADRDTIHALIRGTAVNQDGPSSGLTVPNGPAQEALVRKALGAAQLNSGDIDYIEAHGTGTPLGDPIELQALAQVFAPNRNQPLILGSVKTNIGHLEACSGLAGVLKTLLSLKHGYIPPHLHFSNPTPHLDWANLPLEVSAVGRSWPCRGQPKRAGVSSFGFSGVNAHVILEEAPELGQTGNSPRPEHILTLSARSASALAGLAEGFRQFLNTADPQAFADVCYTANCGRVHSLHRLSLVATSQARASELLEDFLQGGNSPEWVCRNRETPPKIAFLFSGQGSQFPNMGKALYETEPGFREVLAHCDAILKAYLEHSLLDVIYGEHAQSGLINQTAYAQPALFALEYALAKLWMSWGIQPDLLIGHSLGEYTAACIAGVFSLEDGLKLVASRARLMQNQPRTGGMAAVFAEISEIEAVLRHYPETLSVAAYNGPRHCVISGQSQALAEALAKFQLAGVATKPLNVSHAFHSPLMEPILDEFEALCSRIPHAAPNISLVCNLSGELASPQTLNARYWRRHLREPVQFHQCLGAMTGRGIQLCLEIGPKPSLTRLARQALDGKLDYLPSLNPPESDTAVLLKSLAVFYASGLNPDFKGLYQGQARRSIPLPTYPFQRKRYWQVPKQASPNPMQGHPLLGVRLALPASDEIRFGGEIHPARVPYLADHRVFGQVLLPAAAYLEMAVAAGCSALSTDRLCLENVSFQQAMVWEDFQSDPIKKTHCVLKPSAKGGYDFAIYSQTGGSDWLCHAKGIITQGSEIPTQPQLAQISGVEEGDDPALLYQQCHERGVQFGPAFQVLKGLSHQGQSARGELALGESVGAPGDYQLHPILLDGALQTMGAVFLAFKDGTVYLPVALDRLTVTGKLANTGLSKVWVHPFQPGHQSFSVDVELADLQGRVMAQLEGLQMSRAEARQLSPVKPWSDWLYQLEWQPLPVSNGGSTAPWSDACELAMESLNQHLSSDCQAYPAIIQRSEQLSLSYVIEALTQLGWKLETGDRFNLAELAQSLGVIVRHQRLLARMLEILAEAGYLQRQEESWQVLQPFKPARPDDELELAQAHYPQAHAEFTLLQRCGSKLPQVLRGQYDPLVLLFPEHQAVTAANLYATTPAAQESNEQVRRLVQTLLAGLPSHQPLRILEIGAGTGGTTEQILPLLNPSLTEYCYTDISPAFLSLAQQKFQGYPFIRYATLDVEQAPESQGFAPKGYDLIIAANVLHATCDLRRSLAHVQNLIAAGGLLILLEGTAPLRFIDLIFGLLEGWWRFQDFDLRPHHPLLSVPGWHSALAATGFRPLGEMAESPESGGLWSRQALLLAQALPAQACFKQRWLILAHEALGLELAGRVKASGGEAVLAVPGREYRQMGPDGFEFPLSASGQFSKLWQDSSKQKNYTHVVHALSLLAPAADQLDPAGLEAALDLGCASLVEWLKPAVAQNPPPQLWLLTFHAQKALDEDAVSGLAQAPIWGLARTIRLEYPQIPCHRLDLENDQDAADALFEALQLPRAEAQLAQRQGRWHSARLARKPKTNTPDLSISQQGSYLITGGLQGLGLETACWLVAKGAKSLFLTGRSEPSPKTAEQLEQWRQQGVAVTAVQADVGDLQAMAGLIAVIKQGHFPLKGIIHSAGQLDDGILLQQDRRRLAQVFSAKVHGAWNLHCLTVQEPLDFFVLYSSMAALLGSAGQANHAAANAFLDGLAQYRQNLGLQGLSINWGGWAEIGAAAGKTRSQRILSQGMELIPPRLGLEILESLIADGLANVGVAPIQWDSFASHAPAARNDLFISHFTQASPKTQTGAKPESKGVDPNSLANLSLSERELAIRDFMRHQTAQVLRLEIGELDDRLSLTRLGLDSLMAVELRNRVRGQLGIELPLVRFMEDNNLALLASELSVQLQDQLSASQAKPSEEQDPETLLAHLDELSDEQVDALLGAALAEQAGSGLSAGGLQ